MQYDFEEARVKKFLMRRKAKQTAIQLPDGLRPQLAQIVETFEEAKVEPVIMAGSCYGACDLADARAKQLGCDVLVHYGHADMGLPTALPTLYVEARAKESPLEAVREALPQLSFKRAGLLTTIQHIQHLKNVADLLRSNDIQPLIGGPGFMAKYPGQLLGCDFGCARSIASRVDGFIYIGTGEFHPIGAVLATSKRVAVVNPITGGLKIMDPGRGNFLKKRKALIARAASGERFCVVVSEKLGQARFRLAAELVRLLRAKGRKANLAVVDDVNPLSLADFNFDAIVCAACPRIPIDDYEHFEQPILTPFEARVALGDAPFTPYQLDETRKSDFEAKRLRRPAQ